MGNIFEAGLANGIDMYGTLFNLPETGLSERLSGGQKTINTGRIDYSGNGTAADDSNYVYYDAALTGPAPRPTMGTIPMGSVTSQNDTPVTNESQYTGAYGSTGGSAAPQYTARDEQAAYDDQISALDKLLGYTNTQRESGLTDLTNKYNAEKGTLKNQYDSAVTGYNEQRTTNAQCLKTDAYERKVTRSVAMAMHVQDNQCRRKPQRKLGQNMAATIHANVRRHVEKTWQRWLAWALAADKF